MPKFLVAHRSGAHRLAAIALYRALVSQCTQLDIPAERGRQLLHLVRHRFDSFRHTTSHRELKLLFEAGYEAVDRLDAAVAGDKKSKQYILDLVCRAPHSAAGRIKSRNSVSDDYNEPFSPPVAAEGTASSDPLLCQPEIAPRDTSPSRTSIFERAIPHDQLGGTGKRQIPKIFSANVIPVLRFKKPQSPALTGYLNSRIEQRQKRHNLRHRLEAELQVASLEDQWDDIMYKDTGIKDGSSEHAPAAEAKAGNNNNFFTPPEPRWTREIASELRIVHKRLNDERVKNRAMAEKMYKVIDREMVLLAQEQEQERLAEEARKQEIRDGLEGLTDMVDEIIDADDNYHHWERPAEQERYMYRPI